MKPTFIALLALCLALAGCATLNDVGKHLRGADKETEPVVMPSWTSDPSNPNNVTIEKEIREAIKKPKGELTKADLEHVVKLNLWNKQLTELPEGLMKLTQLKELYLERNKLTEVPKVLENLTQLEFLSLHENKLTDVKELEKFTELTLLSLQDNPGLTKAQIDELQKALPKCTIRSNAAKLK